MSLTFFQSSRLPVECAPYIFIVVAICFSYFPSLLQADTIAVYVEPPTIESSSFAGVTTETFDSTSPGVYASDFASVIGTYTGTPSNPFAIVAADQYGGAGGTGNYFAVGVESNSSAVVTLNLYSEANYFGFWWSAGDANNTLTFLQDGVALATFSTANLVGLLPYSPNTTVIAIDGSVYSTMDYYGNPGTGSDSWEPFAYVDIIANGLQFNQVQFSNSINTGFETDNHSVAQGVADPSQGDTIVDDVSFTAEAETPEPASWSLVLSGIAAVSLSVYRRRTTRSGPELSPIHLTVPVL